ncbi:MAG TPA: nickel-responsive transcriptional regulator NikR [Stellaceae bacterium]|nr:nickel-responsive transcriptional regulator NikR [Stellaceae bacterium]
MQRITITIDDDMLGLIDESVRRGRHANRSEAVRDMIRRVASHETVASGQAPCLAVLGYVYDHEARSLARRVTRALHDHHDLTIATTHVHVDHRSCLEASLLRGPSPAIHALAEQLAAERGVRHVNLHVVPIAPSPERHDHGPGSTAHSHIRV